MEILKVMKYVSPVFVEKTAEGEENLTTRFIGKQ